MSEIVSYRREGPVGVITMDDGKVNCLSPRMLEAIGRALDRAEQDGAVVLLTGRVGTFSAGFDLKVFQQGDFEALRGMILGGAELALRVLSFPTPVVVACNGHCLAMGAFLTLCADVRIGASGPFKIALNEVAIGLSVPHFAIEIARQRLAPVHFQRALLTAEMHTPAQAVEAGFLDRVVAPEDLQREGEETALTLSRLDLGAHAATKARVREQALSALRQAIARDEAEAQA